MALHRHEFLTCDFCGALYTDPSSAWPCCKDPSPPKFKVGDVVLATFRIGAGMECVGHAVRKGKITGIDPAKPADRSRNTHGWRVWATMLPGQEEPGGDQYLLDETSQDIEDVRSTS